MSQFLMILGRQPSLSVAELECVFGATSLSRCSPTSAVVESAEDIDVQQFGGVIKAGKIALTLPSDDISMMKKKVVQYFSDKWHHIDHKQTIGISVYDWDISKKHPHALLMELKSTLKTYGVSVRTIPNTDLALNTATSHHNKLGLSPNKTELLLVRTRSGQVIVAESLGAQNITALAARDQARPKTDAFVGMLPPKLAQMMINMSGISTGRILDPFCGTGVVLQEALLSGYDAYGSDLSEKMVAYSKENLAWITQKYHLTTTYTVDEGDAMNAAWSPPITAVVAETYLGQPFSAPPSPNKLKEVRRTCDYIISEFLKNIRGQLAPGTTLVLGVPAWRDAHGRFTHLSVIDRLEELGFTRRALTHVPQHELLYYRESQVVARELLLLTV